MAKKQRSMRTSLRSASKVQERSLTASAERLAEHPEWAVPRCDGHRDHFGRARKHVRRVAEHAEDAERLGKLARRGHKWARAYAATLLVGLHDPEGVVMQNVKTPWGTAAIAVRGTASPMHLVAMQHLDDRKLRAFLVLDVARKKRLTFFSMPEGAGALLVCAGKEGKPPEAFVRDAASAMELLKDAQGWGCPHATQSGDKVVVRWPGAGAFRRCGACAQGHTLLGIVENIAARDALGMFTVEVELAPLQGGERLAQPPIDPAALERYKKGELDDQGLLAAQHAARAVELRKVGKALLVNDGVVHADVAGFIASLKPSPLEEQALRGALEGYDKPILVVRGTPAKVLSEVWQERGVAALAAVAGSDEVAQQIFDRHDVAAKGVGPALQQAQQRGAKAATDAALPTYRHLPPAAAFADRVARAHHAHGKPAAIQALEQALGAPAGLVHAFERTLSVPGRAWKYAPLELEVAAQLEPHAARLLAARPAQYHAALQALARAAGVAEELREG